MAGLGVRGLAALLLGVFVVTLAYGIALPLLPTLIGREFAAGADVSLNIGWMTGAYALAQFLFSPIWGTWSDKRNRSTLLAIGLCGFAIAMAAGAVLTSPFGLYLSRILGGVFAAGILPIAQAIVADAVKQPKSRGRHFAWLGIASAAGLFGGPLIGGAVTGMADAITMFTLLQAGLAVAALATAVATLRWVRTPPPLSRSHSPAPKARRELAILLAITGIVAAGLGAFEVAMTARGQIDPAMAGESLGILFAECMLVMVAAQSLVFNRWVKVEGTARLIAPGLLLLGVALLSLSWVSGRSGLMLGTGAIAAASGMLLPVLAFWISLSAGSSQGRQLGRQTSVASLGQAIGSALAGVLVTTKAPLNLGLILTGALLVVAAAWLVRGLPRLLRPVHDVAR